VELRELAELFADQDVSILGLSQEDVDVENARKMHRSLGGGELPLTLAFDLERRETQAFDRTTAYLVDTDGVVQQVFPMIIHARPSGVVLLKEAMAMNARLKAAAEAESAGAQG
jgi:alkyl hydroperoxide reductase subunit AhpC